MKYFVQCIGFAAVLFLSSCVKDTDEFIADANQIIGPDVTWYSSVSGWMPANVLKNSLNINADIDSISDVSIENTITTNSGLECTIDPNSFVDASDLPISGSIAIESKLITKKGDFIKMSRPTISENKILVSAGAFFIQATKSGKQLKLANGKSIRLKYKSSGANLYPHLTLFNIDETDPEKMNCIENADTLSGVNKIYYSADEYQIKTNKLSWANCYHEQDVTGLPLTKISLTLPVNYTNANTLAYVIFNSQNTVIPLKGDISTKKFKSISIPVGISARVVTITKEGNFYYLGNYSFTTNDSVSGYQSISVTPTKKSFQYITEFLDNL